MALKSRRLVAVVSTAASQHEGLKWPKPLPEHWRKQASTCYLLFSVDLAF